MPKLLLVLLPLAAAMAWLALRAWQGRMPSRQALNVLFSLLLLGYLGGTAGLGIFWVANQQLPVFDWHYLFGYTTVLLLVVHLSFNLRLVWHFLRRSWGAVVPRAADPAEAVPPRRRPLLGLTAMAGLALATGLGYLLGLRHGRTELLLQADPSSSSAGRVTARSNDASAVAAGDAAAAQAWRVVERFHAHSAHSRSGVLRHAASTDWGPGPPPFKRQTAGERVPLPASRGASATSDEAPDLAAIASCLWHTAGISARRGGIAFRTSPSSGALFATELYLLALDVRGLAAGPWHYDPEAHALQRLPPLPGAARGAEPPTVAFGPLDLPAGCHAVVFASAIFARSGHKYGDRTYRYVLADLGHALENLRVAARTQGRREARLLTHFDEQAIGAALGLEPRSEAVLAVAALCSTESTAAPTALEAPARAASPAAIESTAAASVTAIADGESIRAGAGAGAGERWRWTSALLPKAAGEAERLGLTDAVHRATSLRRLKPVPQHGTGPDAAPTPVHAQPTAPTPSEPAGPSFVLPSAQTRPADPLRLIAQRRSRRRFSTQALSVQALADLLHHMANTTALPTTQPAPLLSPAVRIDVLTPAVTGLDAAAWRYDGSARSSAQGARPRLVRRVVHGDTLRTRARAAALDQDVIGDAAVVFVLSLDRAALRHDPFGAARGYRHGFIEAGLMGERLYLAAGALGLAVCGVGAFYDDEAAALVGSDPAREWVVHFAAVGLPQ